MKYLLRASILALLTLYCSSKKDPENKFQLPPLDVDANSITVCGH